MTNIVNLADYRKRLDDDARDPAELASMSYLEVIQWAGGKGAPTTQSSETRTLNPANAKAAFAAILATFF